MGADPPSLISLFEVSLNSTYTMLFDLFGRVGFKEEVGQHSNSRLPPCLGGVKAVSGLGVNVNDSESVSC